ncbi:MAG: sugar phosphate isomerase/epimerase, partial [Clostridia bacterium]|nr:sugar phosphate isomerase/epimerase [Clostridia bacterium]
WIRALANDRGVTFNQAHAPFVFKWGDQEVWDKIAQPRVLRSVEIAALAGAHTIIVHPIHHLPYVGHEEEMHEMNVKYYQDFIPLCQKYGIKVAVENMWQRDPIRKYIIDDVGSRGTSLARLVDELNAIAPDCFTACLDVGHSVLVGEETQDAIRALGGDRLGALHVHDNDYIGDQHTLPGLGRMNWPEISAALKEIGYKGEFTYEADAFLRNFTNDVLPIAVKFMVDVARHWAALSE